MNGMHRRSERQLRGCVPHRDRPADDSCHRLTADGGSHGPLGARDLEPRRSSREEREREGGPLRMAPGLAARRPGGAGHPAPGLRRPRRRHLPRAGPRRDMEAVLLSRWSVSAPPHSNFLRYHFQPFALNLVLPSVKPSGATAKRGTRHLT